MKKIISVLLAIICLFMFREIYASEWTGTCACCAATNVNSETADGFASCKNYSDLEINGNLTCGMICKNAYPNLNYPTSCINEKYKSYTCEKVNDSDNGKSEKCYKCNRAVSGYFAGTTYIWGTENDKNELANSLCKNMPGCSVSCSLDSKYTNKGACENQAENPDLPDENVCTKSVSQIDCQRLGRVWDTDNDCCKIYVEATCENDYTKEQCKEKNGEWTNANCCVIETVVAPIPYCYICSSDDLGYNKKEKVWSEDGQNPSFETNSKYSECTIYHEGNKNNCKGVVVVDKNGEVVEDLYSSGFSSDFPSLGFGESTSSCSEMLGETLTGFLKTAVRTIQGIGCVLAVMSGMLSMASAVASKDKEKIQKAGVKCVKLFIALALILLLPTIIRFIGKVARFNVDCI